MPHGGGILAGLLLVGGACADADESGRPAERSVSVMSWDTVFARGGEVDDSLFGMVSGLASRAGLVYVGDAANGRVVALDADGRHRWTFGRSGAGPGEFRRMGAIHASADGVAVLDPDNARITELDLHGVLQGEVSLQGLARSEDFLPLPGERYLLWTADPRGTFQEVDRAGTPLGGRPVPWWEAGELHPMAIQGDLVGEVGTERWVRAFIFGDRWLGAESPDGPTVRGLYPDSVPWPEIRVTAGARSRTTEFAERPVWTGLAAALAGDTVLVLALEPGTGARFLDLYDFTTGAYLESWAVPTRASAFAVDGSVVYLAVQEPFPGVLAVRPRRVEPGEGGT